MNQNTFVRTLPVLLVAAALGGALVDAPPEALPPNET